jgi:ATP-dependent Clp protease ATP-binding subunit ClpA
MIVDKFNDIPAWFYLNNPNVRMITVPNPDRIVRETFIDNRFEELNAEDLAQLKSKFIDMTEGMKILELDELRRLYKKSGFSVTEITDTVSIYKFGFKENKWEALRGKLDRDIPSQMRKRVKGQEQAIERISRIIKRSVTGLSGMQHSAGENKPRGILFLAGPTGTGKTEIVKTVAELLFGDEKALIRFDMSEYTAEHADQKLFGAPPGYVGYDQGGQLTNAVKSNPFSVLLFDEIEKAHPEVFNLLLQLLDDGRLTDGQGRTVDFRNTIIIMTSNIGGREIVNGPRDAYADMKDTVTRLLRTRFKPEFLIRLDEIIVFHALKREEIKAIAELLLKKLARRLKEARNAVLSWGDDALGFIAEAGYDADYGARPLKRAIQQLVETPLAHRIIAGEITEGASVALTAPGSGLSFQITPPAEKV